MTPPKPKSEKERLRAVVQAMPSDHMARVFEFYFLNMLQAISNHTDLLFDMAAEIMFLLTNGRRKITNINRDVALNLLFQAMINEDRERLPHILIQIGIERNILLDTINRVLIDDNIPNLTCDLYPLRRHLSALMADVLLFRELVYMRYAKMVIKQSKQFAFGKRASGINIEADDTAQNHALATLRALDKFDARSGTLTTFVGNWMRNAAHSIFDNRLGESFSITRNARTKISKGEIDLNNHAVNLDDNPAIENSAALTDPDAVEDEAVDTALKVLRANNLLQQYRWVVLLTKYPVPLFDSEIDQLHASLLRPSFYNDPT